MTSNDRLLVTQSSRTALQACAENGLGRNLADAASARVVVISCLIGATACGGKTTDVSNHAADDDGARTAETTQSPTTDRDHGDEATTSPSLGNADGGAARGLVTADNGSVDAAAMCVPEIPLCGQGEFVCNTQMDWDGDGWWNHQDCNDRNVDVHPCAVERCCDGVDSDCDGLQDPIGVACRCALQRDAGPEGGGADDARADDAGEAPACIPEIPACAQGDAFPCNTQADWDGDGWWNHQDCNDRNVDVHPCTVERCCDGVDLDCDGVDEPRGVDCDCP